MEKEMTGGAGPIWSYLKEKEQAKMTGQGTGPRSPVEMSRGKGAWIHMRMCL
jgi:hypothetical protein